MTVKEKSEMASLECWFGHEDHSAWFDSFSDEQREEMLAEDLSAGRSVPALLTTIITGGVILALVSILLLR